MSLPHSFQQQYHACLGASRSVLAFGAFCTTPFGHRAIGDPKPDRRRWGKKNDGISLVFFGWRQNGDVFFFRCFWLVGWFEEVFFPNPSGSFWWKSLDLEGCNCGLFWGGGNKMTSFLGQKPIKQAIHSKDSIIHQPLYKISNGYGLYRRGCRWAIFHLMIWGMTRFKRTLGRSFLCLPNWAWPFQRTRGVFEEGFVGSTKIKSSQYTGMKNVLADFRLPWFIFLDTLNVPISP